MKVLHNLCLLPLLLVISCGQQQEAVPTYKNWIRDHVHTMKAFRHWEYNLKAYLDFTLAYQRPDGSYYVDFSARGLKGRANIEILF